MYIITRMEIPLIITNIGNRCDEIKFPFTKMHKNRIYKSNIHVYLRSMKLIVHVYLRDHLKNAYKKSNMQMELNHVIFLVLLNRGLNIKFHESQQNKCMVLYTISMNMHFTITYIKNNSIFRCIFNVNSDRKRIGQKYLQKIY